MSCSNSSLTGQDGSVRFKPAGTTFCLQDFTDFPVGAGTDTFSLIKVPAGHDIRLGDPVVFTEVGTGNLDGALTAGTTYYVVTVAAESIVVSATSGGAGIEMTGNGGTGTADTPGVRTNHIKISYAEFAAICQVTSWNLNITRDEIDTVSLPCGPTAGDAAAAPFRTRQAGYADGSGSMEVRFNSDQTGFARRLLQNSLRKEQNGAEVKLYIDTAYTGVGDAVNDAASLYIQGPISIFGFDIGVTPEESTTATLNFSLSGQPTQVF